MTAEGLGRIETTDGADVNCYEQVFARFAVGMTDVENCFQRFKLGKACRRGRSDV